MTKTVTMTRTLDLVVARGVARSFKGGKTYEGVPKSQADKIVAAGAGYVVAPAASEAPAAATESEAGHGVEQRAGDGGGQRRRRRA